MSQIIGLAIFGVVVFGLLAFAVLVTGPRRAGKKIEEIQKAK